MRLAQMQAAFQAAVLEGDSAILTELVDSPHESRAQLLSVYQRAYRLRLMGVLGNDYPLLKRQAGDDEFAAIAAGYIAAHVSTNPDVSHYGKVSNRHDVHSWVATWVAVCAELGQHGGYVDSSFFD